jgi:hypothetical protein
MAGALAAPPVVPEGALLVPSFVTTGRPPWSTGLATIVDGPNGEVVVTALGNVQAPGIGGTAMSGTDLRTGRRVLETASRIALPDADARGPATDLAAYRVVRDARGRAGGKVAPHALPIAARCPESPEAWVPVGSGWVSASIVACTDRVLWLAALPDGAERGAPVLDRTGAVLGVVTADDDPGDGRVAAMASPTLLAHLARRPLPLEPPPPCPWGVLDTGWEPIANPWNYDLPGLHAVLLTDWGLSGAHDEALKRGLSGSELGPLWNEIARLSWENTSANFVRISALVERWNALYRDHAVPLRINPAAQGQVLALMTWHLDHHATITVGSRSVAVDVVSRVDRWNIADPVPTLLTGGSEVVVPLEDVRDSELYRMWSRLDPAAHDPLAASVSTELAAAIGDDPVRVLTSTAAHRRSLDEVVDAIYARSPCSGFAVATLRWRGLTPELDQALAAAVGTGRCAPITSAELARLRGATAAIAAEPALEPALRKLEALLARSAAIEGAGMRLATADDPRARLDAGVAAALSDPATRQLGRARLCGFVGRDRELAGAYAKTLACNGAALGPVPWTPEWGPQQIAVAAWPDELPVSWPRDRDG